MPRPIGEAFCLRLSPERRERFHCERHRRERRGGRSSGAEPQALCGAAARMRACSRDRARHRSDAAAPRETSSSARRAFPRMIIVRPHATDEWGIAASHSALPAGREVWDRQRRCRCRSLPPFPKDWPARSEAVLHDAAPAHSVPPPVLTHRARAQRWRRPSSSSAHEAAGAASGRGGTAGGGAREPQGAAPLPRGPHAAPAQGQARRHRQPQPRRRQSQSVRAALWRRAGACRGCSRVRGACWAQRRIEDERHPPREDHRATPTAWSRRVCTPCSPAGCRR